MMADNIQLICNKPECTLMQTGTCVLNNDPQTCPDRLESFNTKEKVTHTGLEDPLLKSPVEIERFLGSFTLSVQEAQKLMEQRYCKIVGILGAPGAGKTACLVSL